MSRRRRVPRPLVDTVRAFVALAADHCECSEVEAVELVGRALALVAVEVAADDVMGAVGVLLSSAS